MVIGKTPLLYFHRTMVARMSVGATIILLEAKRVVFTKDCWVQLSTGRPARTQIISNRLGCQANSYKGGIRSVGFVHSPLLPTERRGTVSKNLMHVTDWLPTLMHLGQCQGSGFPIRFVPNLDFKMTLVQTVMVIESLNRA